MKIIVTDPLAEEAIEVLKKAGAEVVEDFESKGPALVEKIADFDAIIVRSGTQVTKEIIDAAKKLKVIGRAGTGLDNIDRKAAEAKGIKVLNTPFGNSISACEHAIALMLALCRNIPQGHASVKAGKWERHVFKGTELYKKTIGIIGLGHIGLEVAKRLKAFDTTVLAFDPFAKDEVFGEAGAQKTEFDELLSKSDFITVHVPKTKETIGMIGKEEFAKMKKGVRLINAARGGIVDEKALLGAINAGIVAGAALDVFEQEPPKNKELLSCEKIIFTPHQGANTQEAKARCGVQIAEYVIGALQ